MLSDADEIKLLNYLVFIMPTREMVDRYITPNNRGEAGFVPNIGWVPK